jgi:catechol 2,3-dioxygenase-like lactoylglutathione lyase family enzyme
VRAMENLFPIEGVELTHILVVADLDRARSFYRDVLGATVYREYGDASCDLQFQDSWLLLDPGEQSSLPLLTTGAARFVASSGIRTGIF